MGNGSREAQKSATPGHPPSTLPTRGSTILITSLILIFIFPTLTGAAVLRVPADYSSIQRAIDAANPGDEIWVSEGNYSENIELKSDVALYGGFDGTEIQRTERDFTAHPAIINAAGLDSHVVVMEGITNSRIDGFTITGGGVRLFENSINGGGIYCIDLNKSNNIVNCIIKGNNATKGGGVYC